MKSVHVYSISISNLVIQTADLFNLTTSYLRTTMHPARPVSFASGIEDGTWRGREELTTALPNEVGSNVSSVVELNDMLEKWLKTCTPEERDIFMQSMQDSMLPDLPSLPDEHHFPDFSLEEVTVAPLVEHVQITPSSVDCNPRAGYRPSLDCHPPGCFLCLG